MSFPMIIPALKTAFAAIGSMAPAISAGISVASAGLGYAQAKGAADAQSESNAQANERARQYMIEDYDQMTRMEQQELAGASQKLQQNQVDSAKASASAKVSASAGGVGGLSVQALLGDIFGQEASIRDSVNQNLENTGQQLRSERGSIARNYETTINTRPQPQQPSLLGAALEAGTGVIGAYKDQWKVRGKTT